MEQKYTREELQMRQVLPLSLKIAMTKTRIRDWVNHFGTDGVYISFSGGKDSTVLMDLVRNECGYKDVEAMFVDVPTQYPELKKFATSFENVTVVKPKIGFAQVVEKYGFPIFSKENADAISGAKKYLTRLECATQGFDRQTDRQTDRFRMLITTEQSKVLESMPIRTALIMGMLTKDNKKMVNIPNKDRSCFSKTRYEFMLNSPFDVSGQCCNVMKKTPAHDFYKKTNKVPIIATMASESRLRTQKWLQNGCNAWDSKIPTSTPMSFWTEQDVLLYIKERNLPICSVYGDVVVDDNQIDGQMCIADYANECGLFDLGNPPLKTTGCQRSGCMLCGFGCTEEKESRFLRLKETHPNMYILMDNIKNNGYSFHQALDWINENGGFDIKH